MRSLKSLFYHCCKISVVNMRKGTIEQRRICIGRELRGGTLALMFMWLR